LKAERKEKKKDDLKYPHGGLKVSNAQLKKQKGKPEPERTGGTKENRLGSEAEGKGMSNIATKLVFEFDLNKGRGGQNSLIKKQRRSKGNKARKGKKQNEFLHVTEVAS